MSLHQPDQAFELIANRASLSRCTGEDRGFGGGGDSLACNRARQATAAFLAARGSGAVPARVTRPYWQNGQG
jgi:hypothetical protein